MKKPNRIGRTNSRGISHSQAKKPETTRIKVLMPRALQEAIHTAAKARNQTFSQFAEAAIRKVVAGETPAPTPESEIQKNWQEVASIDFTGYLDRDCEERIIYKTPEGNLKAARSSDEGLEAIEDVTREQVVKWIHECIIPEEF